MSRETDTSQQSRGQSLVVECNMCEGVERRVAISSKHFHRLDCSNPRRLGLVVPCWAGESDYEKPRILEIAEVMQNIDSLDEGKKKQERAVKKGKEAELHARKLEVSLNETR